MLVEPWRTTDWTPQGRKRLMDEIAAYNPPLNSVEKIRVLLVGQVGAGKSSFFNSVNSVFRNHVRSQAMVGVHDTSVTWKYRIYPVRLGSKNKTLPITFCDTMGLEEREFASLKIDDVINILKGHVPDWYQFNPHAAMQPDTPGYIVSPSLKDKIHCVVFVIDGSKLEILSEKVEQKLKTLRQKAKELDVPQIILLTKVDEICSPLKENISDVYRSRAILEQAMRNSSRRKSPHSETSKGADCMLEKPWRLIDQPSGGKKQLMDEIAEYKPPLNSVQKIRVLFVGQIGAGKSSFFNSVDSVFCGHVINNAPAGADGKSVTKKYRTYEVKNRSTGKPLPILFCDTMGLEERELASLRTDDVISILKGHIPDGYQFNPIAAMQPNTPGYIKSPSLKEEIHCVVFVVDGSNIEILPEKMETKLKEIREKANEFELPQLILLTKVDEISSFLKEDVSDVYKSQAVKQKMETASGKLGIPLSQIVPVKDYCSEVELKDDVDILILLALRQIVRFAQRYLENFSSNQSAAVEP
ncbi:interferon-induced protein 44-like isoform X5 [Pogona vitticeps]